MKKIILLPIIGLLLISVVGIAQNRIVENPDYESSNTMHFEINKLELKDSATILYCDVYSTPRPEAWISLSSKSYIKGKSGQIYKLLRSEGFELDKKVTMPQSGNVSFILYMQALDKDETSFDFIEGDYERAFKVKGIKTFNSPPVTPISCVLKGEVINRPQSSRLILNKDGGDSRVSAKYIPVRDGKFEYVLYCYHVESYELTFFDEKMNGGWRPIKFFTDSDVVSFELFPMDEYYKNVVEGGQLNEEYTKYLIKKESMLKNIQVQLDSLMNIGKFYSQSFMEIRKQIDTTDDKTAKDSLGNLMGNMYDSGDAFTPEANDRIKKGEEQYLKFKNWEIEYIQKNTSLLAYSLLVDRTDRALGDSKEDIPQYIELYKSVYSQEYPTHPYSKKMENLINGYSSIKVGGSFIDFTAPDFSGNSIKLSEQIKGKIAVIELWASWCGPCRRSAKSLIPVYEAYKDKGFTVVGIARERELSTGIYAAKRDNYPWLNLIELEDAGKIWEKYGLGNSGGGSFLVDKDGTILAIRPSAEEVKTFLDKLLE